MIQKLITNTYDIKISYSHLHNLGCDDLKYEITESPAELTSPDYPKPYPGGKSCANVIKFPDAHIVKLTFLEFDLEYRRDHWSVEQVL